MIPRETCAMPLVMTLISSVRVRAGSDENDGRQHLKSEVEIQMGTLFAEFAENKLRADKGIAQQTVDGITGFLECNAAGLNSKYKNCEDELQAQTPRHRLQTNGAPVGREGISQHQHGQEAENS